MKPTSGNWRSLPPPPEVARERPRHPRLRSDAGVACAVTELLEGETLRERPGSGPLSPRRAIEYALQIARGLAAAHDKGIAHRDLKPENVFITRDAALMILTATSRCSLVSGAR